LPDLPAIRVALRNIQRSDLNLLAAYRKIPILGAPPATVTYTRANTRAVYRKTVEESAAMLENLSSPAAIADRELLLKLDRRVTHLALVKDRYQNIRANVLYARLDPKGRGRVQIAAELPLMYNTGARRGRRTEPPDVYFPTSRLTTTKQRTRAAFARQNSKQNPTFAPYPCIVTELIQRVARDNQGIPRNSLARGP
jgi:hypothetical protein